MRRRSGVPNRQLISAPGAPVVMEIEAIEPLLYLATKPGAAEVFATAILES